MTLNKQISLKEEKSFGYTFSAFFLILAIVGTFKNANIPWGLLGASFGTFAITLGKPNLFKYPNLYWLKFGSLLHKITSPIILAALFYLVFFPFGVVLRKLKVLSFKMKPDSSLDTYWIEREVPGPKPETMKHSF